MIEERRHTISIDLPDPTSSWLSRAEREALSAYIAGVREGKCPDCGATAQRLNETLPEESLDDRKAVASFVLVRCRFTCRNTKVAQRAVIAALKNPRAQTIEIKLEVKLPEATEGGEDGEEDARGE